MEVMTPMAASGMLTESIKETRRFRLPAGLWFVWRNPRYVVAAAFFVVFFVFGQSHKVDAAQVSQQPVEIKYKFAHKIPHSPRLARLFQVGPSA